MSTVRQFNAFTELRFYSESKMEELENIISITNKNIECFKDKETQARMQYDLMQYMINITERKISKNLKKRKPTAEDREEYDHLTKVLCSYKAKCDLMKVKAKGYENGQKELKETNYQRQEEIRQLKEDLREAEKNL